MRPHIQAILFFLGVVLGTFFFLLCASLWSGSPIQDLVSSAHSGIITQPSHKMTEDQLESLNVLLEHQAVIPGDILVERIVDFYTTLLNQLIGLIAVLGIIAYMYIKSSSKEDVQAQANEFLRSKEFENLVDNIGTEKFSNAFDLYVLDYDSRLEYFQDRLKRLVRKVEDMERNISNQDSEDSDGKDLDIRVDDQNGGG